MKLLWLNCNKGTCSPTRGQALRSYLSQRSPDVALFSELKRLHGDMPIDMAGYRWAYNSRNLGILIRDGLEWASRQVMEDFFASVYLQDLEIAAIYLDSISAKRRKSQLQAIHAYAKPGGCFIMGGDFNTVTRPRDGMFNGAVSTWVKPGERDLIASLLSECRLEDPYLDRTDGVPHFSFVAKSGAYAFRSDFVLCSSALRPHCKIEYDDATRLGPRSFTDHAAVLCELRWPPAA